MAIVDIYLDSTVPHLLLSVPHSDIRRLSYRPLKWLRFVTFTICGARGDLLQSHDGPVVNYDSTSIIGPYYYQPIEPYAYVDYNVLDDRIGSSVQTERRRDLRRDVIERDGPFCVITGELATDSDACYIIPRSKGYEYIQAVIQRRRGCYGGLPHLQIDSINSAENGIMLFKGLHSKFGRGAVALLKTPNFALNPDDIPRFGDGPMPSSRVTMQYFEIPNGRLPTPPYDAVFTGRSQDRDENEPPPAILLDFMYGAAAYERWGKGEEMADKIHDSNVQDYRDIPIVHDDAFSEDSGGEPDHPNDGDYVPGFPSQRYRTHLLSEPDHPTDDPLQSIRARSHSLHHKYPRSSNPAERPEPIINAMDNMNALMMRMNGLTPEIRMAMWQKEVEEEQSKNEAISRSKVLDWMNR